MKRVALVIVLGVWVAGCASPKAKSCSVAKRSDGSVKISCPDGSSATVSPGKNGTDGSSCTVTDNGDGSSTISCADGTSVVVHSGTNGSSCSVADTASGAHTITCSDGTSVTVVDGTTCTVATDPDGSRWLRCDDGTQTRLDPAALVDITDEPPGYTCANGGVRIATGVDDNGDGILEPSEVDSVRYVCGQVSSAPECGLFPGVNQNQIHPAPGSTDALVSEDVIYGGLGRLTPMDSMDITLALDADGSSVPGTVTTDLPMGNARFHPDSPLAPLTTYDGTITLSAQGCTASKSFSFTTSDYGAPLGDPASMPGKVWLGGVQSGWGLLSTATSGPLGQDMRFMLSVDAVRDAGLPTAQADMTIAPAEAAADVQDFCTMTTPSTADLSASPVFDAPFSRLQLEVQGAEIYLHAGHVTGVLSSDLSTIGGVDIEGWVDVEETLALNGESMTPQMWCNTIQAAFGLSCVPCPTGPVGSQDQCYHVEQHDMTFTALPGASIVSIARDQRENHLCSGSCSDGADNDGDGLVDTDPECDPATWP